MSQPLPGAWTLVKDSWKLFTSTWNESVSITIWILYVGILRFVMVLLAKLFPPFLFLSSLMELAMALVVLLVSIRIMRAMLQLESGNALDPQKETFATTWPLVLPFVWIGILNALIVLGGLILFVIPGIYLGVALSFSIYFLLTENSLGIKALGSSRDLIKGRWWATFGRQLLASVVFGLGILATLALVSGTIALIAGPQAFLNMENGQPTNSLAEGVLAFIQSILQAAILPLFISFQVKLFRALQRTR